MTHHPQVEEENSSVRKADENLREVKSKIFHLIGKLDNGSHSSNQLQGVDEALIELFLSKLHTERAEIQQDINSVLAMLDGDTDRVIIANYVRTYLLNNNAQ